jgi:hypothetical protein
VVARNPSVLRSWNPARPQSQLHSVRLTTWTGIVLVVGSVLTFLGLLMFLNLGGTADKMARFYSLPPRWLPGPPGGHKPQAHRLSGAVLLASGAGLVVWTLITVAR